MNCSPAGENCDRHQKCSQHYQPETDAINTQVITRSNRADPANVLLKSKLTCICTDALDEQREMQDPEKAPPAVYAKMGYDNLKRFLKEGGLI